MFHNFGTQELYAKLACRGANENDFDYQGY